MKKRGKNLAFLAFVGFLFLACSKNHVDFQVAPPLVLAKYEEIQFVSIPFNGIFPPDEFTTQYGYSMDFRDTALVHFSIRNDSRTHFHTRITPASQDGNFTSYAFHTNSGDWTISPESFLRPAYNPNASVQKSTDILTTISDGSGNGSFALRGVFAGGLQSEDLLTGNIKGYDNSLTIAYNIFYKMITWDSNFNEVVNDLDFSFLYPIEIPQRTFRQAGIDIKHLATNPSVRNRAVLVIDARRSGRNFLIAGDTVFINPGFYNKNQKKVSTMAIAYKFGLEFNESDNRYNLMDTNFLNLGDTSRYHLNHDQWRRLRSRLR